MIPRGWTSKCLEEVSKITSGGTPSRSNPDYWAGSIPWVTTAEIGNKYIKDTKEKITEYALNNSSAKLFPRGTVLVAMYGQGKTRGLASILNIEATTNQACAAIISENDLDNEYLYYNLHNRYEELRSLSNDGSQKNLSGSLLKAIPILIPSIFEQKRIAEILSTWDRAIEVTEKLIANSKAQKKALMQKLLTGKERLPGFEGEWNQKALSDLGKTYNGLSGKTKADFGSGKPFIPYKNVFANAELDMSELEYVRLSDGEKQNTVKSGDIIFTTSSETPEEVGMSSAVLADNGELYLNSFCFGFRIKKQNEFLPNFAKHLFRSLELRRAISSLAQGSTRYNLSKNEFLKVSIQLPSSVEQEKIVEVLDAVETTHSTEQKKLQKLKAEKSALMQQLLTGKRRVKIDKEAAA